MNAIKTFFAIAVFLMAGSYSFGQEMKAEKYDNPEWVSIAYIKFKPMKKDPAMSIIENYFAKADQDAGIKAPTAYHLSYGEYDMMVIWEMEEGVEMLNYKMTPDDVKWMNSMAKVAGGQDKAMEKIEEFSAYVEKWDTSLARKE
ncbi:MAG TPA: hypothetical protein VJ973_07895 [Christiangramia sp.]|nr:hypothetical protein [Christiangramia sp.]